MKDGLVTYSKEGAVQGSPLSPLLSNIVLDELDKELERRDLEFCRFADDCNIFVKSPKAAERVMSNVSKYIETKLKLLVTRAVEKAYSVHWFTHQMGQCIRSDRRLSHWFEIGRWIKLS